MIAPKDSRVKPVRIEPTPFIYTHWYPMLVVGSFLFGISVMIFGLMSLESNRSNKSDRVEYRAALSEYKDSLDVHKRLYDEWMRRRSFDLDSSESLKRLEKHKAVTKEARERFESLSTGL